ncbi:MAG: virulence protein, partial [Sphingomonadales bacterium]|nr:virulence protein [Sphingomonadales bacterium]
MPRTRVPERLEKRAREIVEALDGTWSRSRGMCCCPAHDDRTPSLSVTIGVRAILFHCFAGCSNEAVLASLCRIGVKACELFDGRGEPIAARTRDDLVSQNALRLWRAASALTEGPAQTYLAGRQIRISSPDLRYHARTPLGPKGSVRFLPAMLAAVRNDEGILALHRTFLEPKTFRLARFDGP